MKVHRLAIALLALLLTTLSCKKEQISIEAGNVELPPATAAEELITRVMPSDLLAGGRMKVISIYGANGKAWVKAYRVERNGVARENEIYDVVVKKIDGVWKTRDPFDAEKRFR